MDDALARLHEAIRAYQCPGCALAAECRSVEHQPLKHGCARHRFSKMVFGARHGIVLGVELEGPGWVANGLPPAFDVFSIHARTFPILQEPPGKAGNEVSPMQKHLDLRGNTLVRWYIRGVARQGITTVHLGDVRAVLPRVPELTREHLEELARAP